MIKITIETHYYIRIFTAFFSGWWLGHPSEKYEFVNWDDDIPNINGETKLMFQTTNQTT